MISAHPLADLLLFSSTYTTGEYWREIWSTSQEGGRTAGIKKKFTRKRSFDRKYQRCCRPTRRCCRGNALTDAVRCLHVYWRLFFSLKLWGRFFQRYRLTITKKMAACTFYQIALRAPRVNDWIKMTRNSLMMGNFSKTKKLTSCLMPVLQKTCIRFLNDFRPQCILVKCTSAILFAMVNLIISFWLHSNLVSKLISRLAAV